MRVELTGIHKRFGSVYANREVSLVVEAGSIHGLLGENGAGKSTLVKILSGFLAKDRGGIRLNGQPVEVNTPADALGAGIGMLHQDPLDFPPMTVLDNWMVGRKGGHWLTFASARRELAHLSESLQFSLDPDERVSTLTVGERQQLELLRLLSLGAQVLILDEPTTGISAIQKTSLFAALKKLAGQGKSVIFVSHKLEDVNELCDRVTVMRQGEVVGSASIPCSASQLVGLMFGKELAPPRKPPCQSQEPLLQLDHIRLQNDRMALELDELTVHHGEVIGLAGLEGSGQNLLLLVCAGLLSSPSGRIRLLGQELQQQPYRTYRQAGISYLPADRLRDGLIAGLSIQEHVALRGESVWIHPQQTLEQTQALIQRFNIRGKPSTAVDRLSGGNQQRTQLALLPDPLQVILMEHPTRGLDIESTLWVWEQLVTRCQGGAAILFMSSDLDEIMQYSDRVMVFSSGKISDPIPTGQLTVDRLGRMIGGQFTPELSSTPG